MVLIKKSVLITRDPLRLCFSKVSSTFKGHQPRRKGVVTETLQGQYTRFIFYKVKGLVLSDNLRIIKNKFKPLNKQSVAKIKYAKAANDE